MWLPTPLSPPCSLSLPLWGVSPTENYSFTTCRAVQPLWGRPADGRSDWLSAHVYFLVVGMSDEIKHCSAACQVPSVGFQRNAKSLGYGTCGRADWPTAVRGAPLHNCLNTFSFWLFYFWPSVIVPHFIAIVPQFCQDSIELYEPNNSRIFGRSNPNYINWRQNIIMARFQFRFSI